MNSSFDISKDTILVFVIVFLSSLNVFGQLPKVVPLTPNAAALVKSGDYKVGAITGRPAIDFPVYTVESGSLKIPISLGYDGGAGIQVTQLASWVGLGWSLNIGNMITRTVRGLPDEDSFYGWMNDPTSAADMAGATDYESMRRYADGVWDPSPDYFSYNLPSKSGRFVYRKTTQKFEPIPFEPIDITHQNGGQGGNYQITDNDGTRYFFEYKKIYTNVEDLAQYPGPLINYTQSWYLTKMISANNTDTISLTYETKGTSAVISPGVSTQLEWLQQKLFTRVYTLNNGGTYNNEGITQTSRWLIGVEPVLKEINFRGGKVIFHANTARKDYPGPMLDSIVILNKQSVVQKIQFNYDYFIADQPQGQYDYRLKLNSFGKTDLNDGVENEMHSFQYNENVNLPSTSSTAQDYWGYYNGRDQGFLMNKPPNEPELFNPHFVNNIWVGIADRSVSEQHIQAGILKKIIYPNKGYSVFDFESNKYNSEYVSHDANTQIASARVTGIAKNIAATEIDEFTWNAGYLQNMATLKIYFSANKGPGPFVLEDVQKVQILDITDGTQVGTWSHVTNIYSPQEINTVLYLTPGHSYRIISSVKDDASESNPTYLTMTMRATTLGTSQSITKSGGGLRIKEIRNYESDGRLLSREGYNYHIGNGIDVGLYLRSDRSFEKNSYTRVTRLVDEECAKVLDRCRCVLGLKTEIIHVGEGCYPQVTLEGATVVYGGVTKIIYDQDGNINGKTVYSRDLNLPSNTSIYNPNVAGQREYLNNIITGGPLTSEKHYAYNRVTEQYTLVKEKLFNYNLKHYGAEPITAMYRIMYEPSGCSPTLLSSPSDFTHMQYSLNLGVYKLDSSTERDYDVAGNLIVDNTTNYYYDNLSHMEVTRVEKTGSDQSIVKDVIKYPGDFTDNSYGSNLLRAKSIKIFPLETVTFRDNNQIKKQTDTYQEYSGNVWLGTRETMFGNSLPDILKYEKYDAFGNALEIQRPISASSIVKHSYAWGYNSQYPIAEAKNSAVNEFYYNGFEETGISAFAHTGKKVASTNQVNWQIPNGRAYVISYWYRSGSQWIYSGEIAYNGYSYTLTGGDAYDDVVICPKDAKMSTYTYDPLVGMTSQIDPSGRTTYYQYDALQRLKAIKDQNGNVIKSFDYHYKP